MDNSSKKNRQNSSYPQDTLAQPLKLKESLRIRDGLEGADSTQDRWPLFWVSRLEEPDLRYFLVSDN